MCCHHFLSEEQVRKLSLQGTLQVYWVESLPRWVCILYAGSGIFRAVQDTHGWDPEALKSQDHRIIEVGRDPLRSSSPTLLLKAGSTWKVAQDHTSQDGDSIMFWATCASVGQPSQRKKCSIAYNRVFLSFSLCPLLLVQLLGTAEESLILSSLLPLLRYWYALVRSFWTSQGEESWLSQ